MRLKRFLPILLFIGLLSVPLVSRAQGLSAEDIGLSETASTAGYDSAGDISTVVGRVISVALGLVGFIFFAMIVYAGVMWMTAGGNEERAKKARDNIKNAVIGIVITTAAYAISTAVINAITTGEISDSSTTTSSSATE